MLAGEAGERVDLLRDPALLLQRERDRGDDVGEGRLRGVGAGDLRQSGDLRVRVASDLSRVRSALDGLMVDRPRRKIIRPNMGQGEVS